MILQFQPVFYEQTQLVYQSHFKIIFNSRMRTKKQKLTNNPYLFEQTLCETQQSTFCVSHNTNRFNNSIYSFQQLVGSHDYEKQNNQLKKQIMILTKELADKQVQYQKQIERLRQIICQKDKKIFELSHKITQIQERFEKKNSTPSNRLDDSDETIVKESRNKVRKGNPIETSIIQKLNILNRCDHKNFIRIECQEKNDQKNDINILNDITQPQTNVQTNSQHHLVDKMINPRSSIRTHLSPTNRPNVTITFSTPKNIFQKPIILAAPTSPPSNSNNLSNTIKNQNNQLVPSAQKEMILDLMGNKKMSSPPRFLSPVSQSQLLSPATHYNANQRPQTHDYNFTTKQRQEIHRPCKI